MLQFLQISISQAEYYSKKTSSDRDVFLTEDGKYDAQRSLGSSSQVQGTGLGTPALIQVDVSAEGFTEKDDTTCKCNADVYVYLIPYVILILPFLRSQ